MDRVELALGKAIQTARQSAGLTQQELCGRADLSYSTLAKIERGAIKTPSVFTVARIASVLGVSLDYLLGNVEGLAPVAPRKVKSKSGISFVYVDINGCLVHFFHAAFAQIALETGAPIDIVETTFWHYNDAACRGELSLEEFNARFADKLGVEEIRWQDYYLSAIEPITEMQELVRWAIQHYRIGLLSNIMPGLIAEMLARDLLPKVAYDVIIDSSQVKSIKPEAEIYEIATQKAGVPQNEILFIDDSRTNLMAAEQFGWRVMWFDDMRPSDSVARVKSALEMTN
ncbi:MAG TPA: HAD-IA family hydrolase [Candidatus Saccharibacteria bacterium]|jgi:FMN phosphatase YigB (HAD superfamily)/DNA-binding XRE family transcriptional regulator|nr:HAD-IA family hydrolase [Candidatus Saccharibacteria bacterium]